MSGLPSGRAAVAIERPSLLERIADLVSIAAERQRERRRWAKQNHQFLIEGRLTHVPAVSSDGDVLRRGHGQNGGAGHGFVQGDSYSLDDLVGNRVVLTVVDDPGHSSTPCVARAGTRYVASAACFAAAWWLQRKAGARRAASKRASGDPKVVSA